MVTISPFHREQGGNLANVHGWNIYVGKRDGVGHSWQPAVLVNLLPLEPFYAYTAGACVTNGTSITIQIQIQCKSGSALNRILAKRWIPRGMLIPIWINETNRNVFVDYNNDVS